MSALVTDACKKTPVRDGLAEELPEAELGLEHHAKSVSDTRCVRCGQDWPCEERLHLDECRECSTT